MRTFLLSVGLVWAGLFLSPGLFAQPVATPESIQVQLEAMQAAKAKNYDKAIKSFTEEIGLTPKNPQPYYMRGCVYGEMKKYDKAGEDFNRAIGLDPKEPAFYEGRGRAFYLQKKYAPTLADLRQVIALSPNLPQNYNSLAWFLATCPEAEFRDGRKAVEYATKACELAQWKNANFVDTLAAACAEAGDFDSAVKWESECLIIPGTGGGGTSTSSDRLALYQARKPYHEEK